MASERFERSLVAILVGDLAGFTTAVTENDVAALLLARAFRKLISEMIPDFGGRIVDDVGDGFLAEFGSASDAARCGVAIQQAVAKRNQDAGEEGQLKLRLCVCLGEVLRDGSRILGASVSLAFSLTSYAEVGGLSASIHVAEQLEGSSEFSLSEAGVQRVGGLPKPVRIYRVRTGVEAREPDSSDADRDPERRLAAILHADVAGWSRLMATQEAATVEGITRYREAMVAHVVRRRGRVIDTRADNVLAEFPASLDAVLCGIEIQRDLAARNEGRDPGSKLEFRVGIHLGDLRVEGDRVYGSALNIAARLEALAESGGICLSAAVHDQVRYHLDVPFVSLGEKKLKNIPYPVRAYRIRPRAEGASPRRPRWWQRLRDLAAR